MKSKIKIQNAELQIRIQKFISHTTLFLKLFTFLYVIFIFAFWYLNWR